MLDTRKPAAAYSLDGQIEIFIHTRKHQVLRTISFDEGRTWVEWRKLAGHKTSRPVGFACSGDARSKYLAYRVLNPLAGTPMEDGFADDGELVFKRAEPFGVAWDGSSAVMDGDGKFLSGPAVLCSADGSKVFLFGRGRDRKIYWAHSADAGNSWLWRWAKLGDATFKSEPAVVMSADGRTLMIFAVGMDDRCYFSRSIDGGQSWNPYAGPLGQGEFTSGPGACLSADGRKVMVAGRGRDDRIWTLRSDDRGDAWSGQWSPILEGTFNGGPGLCATWDLSRIFVFAVGKDQKLWKARTPSAGAPFEGWWLADSENRLAPV